MSYQPWLSVVKQQKAFAVIRAAQMEVGINLAKAVAAGGMQLIEVTWNSDRALDLLEQVCQELPDCTIGMGTILDLPQLHQAVRAGAKFLFSPHCSLELIQAAQDYGIPIVPGALSPTEIVSAWQAGAPAVKVFPIQAMGGSSYIQALQGPLGQIPLIPTGGVTFDNARALLDAGALAVGLSGQLFPKPAIAAQDWTKVTEQAKTLMQILAGSRTA